MAQSKVEFFEEFSLRLSGFNKALAHPARLAILETIAKNEICNCGEIVDTLPLAQSTVSQHLKELKKCGIIVSETEGSKSCYSINWNELEDNFGKLTGFANKLKDMQPYTVV